MPLSWTALGQFRQDAPLYAVVGVYALAAWTLSLYLGDVQKYKPFQYVLLWMVASTLILAVIGVVRAFRNDPGRPVSSFVSLVKKHWNRDFLQRLPIILAVGVFYGVFTSVKVMLPDIHPVNWDPHLAAIDYELLGNRDGWRLVAAIIPDGLPLEIMDFIYSRAWFVLIMSFGAYVATAPAMRHQCRQ